MIIHFLAQIKIIFFLVIFLFLHTFSLAQQFSVEHFTEKEGLLNNEIAGVFQDDHGFIWIASGLGFSRINGREIKNYKGKEFDFKYEFNLDFYPNGNVLEWYHGKINLKNGKIIVPKNERVEDIHKGVNSKREMVSFTSSFAKLIDNQGYKWAYLENDKAIRFKDNDTIDLNRIAKTCGFKITNISVHSNNLMLLDDVNFIKDNQSDIWVKSQDKLYKYDYAKNTFVKYNIEARNITSVFIDSKNRIWFLRAGEESTLYMFQGGNLKSFNKAQTKCNRFPDELSMVEKKNGEIFIACLDGIIEFKNGNFTLSKNTAGISKLQLDREEKIIASYCKGDHILEYYPRENLPYESKIWFYDSGKFTEVLSIEGIHLDVFIDNQNIIWVATQNGLYKCTKTNFQVVKFKNVIGFDPSKYLDLALITEMKTSVYIFNNRQDGIWVYKNGTLEPLISKMVLWSEYHFKDSKGNLWIIIDDEQIFKITKDLKVTDESKGDYSKSKNRLSNYFYEYKEELFLVSTDNIYLKDKNGFNAISKGSHKELRLINLGLNTVYYAETNTAGKNQKCSAVHQFNFKTRKYQKLNYIPEKIPAYIYEAKDKFIFVFENDFVYVGKNENKNSKTFEFPNKNGYLKPNSIVVDGIVWFKGDIGLGLLDTENKKNPVHYFTMKDGLSFDKIKKIWLSADSTQLIISHPDGIDILDLQYFKKFKKLRFQKYIKQKDFDPTGTFLPIENGFLFSSTNGFTEFNPNQKLPNHIPKLYLESIRLNGEITDWKARNYKFINTRFDIPKDMVLSYDENNLNFDLLAVTNHDNEKLIFRYKLKGLDEQWQTTPFASIRYANIPAGEYTLQVKVLYPGKYESETLSYAFKITPPFWKTIWFNLLLISGIIFGIYKYFQFKTKRLLNRQKELEATVVERTKEVVLEKKEADNQRFIAEEQRTIVEHKNKEILDSIQYAKRLQDAILPPVKLVREYLEDSFVLYRPKDIVAGDFYWMETVDDLTLFAVADCTGHGVPGAMLSVVCANALNKCVKEYKLTDPAEILNATREIVVETFENNREALRDGMDISLCVINERSKSLQWSGANNPLWIIRNQTNVIEEIKADRQPIGYYEVTKNFTKHELRLNEGDVIYLFSDGFTDQFGGADNKKFKLFRFRELLLEIKNEAMEIQRQKLNDTFDEWRNEDDQVDDVCIIGVKIPNRGVTPFTARELEIIPHIVKGHNSKQIGENLFISSHTVDTHRRRILSKAGVSNTVELIQYARLNKLA